LVSFTVTYTASTSAVKREDALSGSGGCVACSNWLDDEAVVGSSEVGVKVGIGFLLLPLAIEIAHR